MDYELFVPESRLEWISACSPSVSTMVVSCVAKKSCIGILSSEALMKAFDASESRVGLVFGDIVGDANLDIL